MDFQGILEKSQASLKEKLPFVLYRKPQASAFRKEMLHAFFQHDKTLHTLEDFEHSGFVFAPFAYPNEKSLLIPQNTSTTHEAEIPDEKFSKNKADFSPSPDEKKAHIGLVEKGIEAIRGSSLEKVVLSRQQNIVGQGKNPVRLFQKILSFYPNAFTYCWFHPKVGLWLGATPETLLKVERGRLQTMALAGTKQSPDGENPQWTQKERDEQEFVTRDIEKKLAPFLENLKISDVKNQQAGRVWHLKTELSGKLSREKELGKIVKNLHPTPAICGTPTREARKFILKNEPHPREFYTGFLGELNVKHKAYRSSRRRNQENRAFSSVKKSSLLFVNLRCMQVQQKDIRLYLGGGITKDSQPEAEWKETENKAETMLKCL